MQYDRYALFARLFPAILSCLPVLVISHFLLIPEIGGFVTWIMAVRWVGNITLMAPLIYFLMQLNRWTSKSLFEDRLFDNGLAFPTTESLFYSKTSYSETYVDKLHSKILMDFGIELSSQEGERLNEESARKKASEAVSQIRAKVGAGRLVLQHNKEYGFARNMAGGSVFGLATSIVALFLFGVFNYYHIPFVLAVLCTCGYAIFLLFADRLLRSRGRDYAKVLLQEYLADV